MCIEKETEVKQGVPFEILRDNLTGGGSGFYEDVHGNIYLVHLLGVSMILEGTMGDGYLSTSSEKFPSTVPLRRISDRSITFYQAKK